MRVLKFGGSSMANEQTWLNVLQIIEKYHHPVVIVSATARTTQQLIRAAELTLQNRDEARNLVHAIKERHQHLIHNFISNRSSSNNEQTLKACHQWIDKCVDNLNDQLSNVSSIGELSPQTIDAVASIGEKLSSRLFSYCGTVYGLNTKWADATDIIKTDSEFGNAKPIIEEINQRATLRLNRDGENDIFVMGGYYGSDLNENTTTLGFDGSDFTASLIGSALDAEAIEIWTDVNGIFTCDPMIVENAQPIRELSFSEATEMAYFGAKVLHPSTMNPAEEKDIPILVKNFFDPDHPGTIIQRKSPSGNIVKAMTFLRNVEILTVSSTHAKMGYEFLCDVFNVIKKYHALIKVVTTSESSVSIVLESSQVKNEIIASLEKIGEIDERKNQAIISLIGCKFSNTDQITEEVLSALKDVDISILSYCSTMKQLNIVLSENNLIHSVRAIHENLFQQVMI